MTHYAEAKVKLHPIIYRGKMPAHGYPTFTAQAGHRLKVFQIVAINKMLDFSKNSVSINNVVKQIIQQDMRQI